jgi:hypothetical protein
MTEGRTKIVYAQARRPGISRIEFLSAWREHGGRAMVLPDYFGKVLRYVQADAFATAGSLAGEARNYDGVGEIVFQSLAELEEANASESRTAIVVPHGRELFGSPNPISVIACEEVEWFDRLASVKLYTFVQRQPALSRDAFEAGWVAACRRWRDDAATRACVRGYTRSVSVRTDSEFDGVEETTFDTLAEARSAYEDAAFLVRSLPACKAAVTVLTQQVVLLDTELFG